MSEDNREIEFLLRHMDQRFDSIEKAIKENKTEGKERFDKMEVRQDKLDSKMVKLIILVMAIAEGVKLNIPFLKGLMQ